MRGGSDGGGGTNFEEAEPLRSRCEDFGACLDVVDAFQAIVTKKHCRCAILLNVASLAPVEKHLQSIVCACEAVAHVLLARQEMRCSCDKVLPDTVRGLRADFGACTEMSSPYYHWMRLDDTSAPPK